MVADLVSGSFDMKDHLGVADGSFANEKESGLGIVPLKNLQDLEREGWVWAIVEGKGNHRTMSPNSINNIWSESLNHAQDKQGLHPEHQEPYPEESGGRPENSHHVSTPRESWAESYSV